MTAVKTIFLILSIIYLHFNILQLNVPDDGVLVHGLYMDASAWNMDTMKMIDAKYGEMWAEMPMLHMEPGMYDVTMTS